HGRAASRHNFDTVIGNDIGSEVVLVNLSQLIVSVALLIIDVPGAVAVVAKVVVQIVVGVHIGQAVAVVIGVHAVNGDDLVGAVHEIGLGLHITANTAGRSHIGNIDIVL